MMMIFFSSVMSSIGHILQGHVAWSYSIILIISSYIGAQIGYVLTTRLNLKLL